MGLRPSRPDTRHALPWADHGALPASKLAEPERSPLVPTRNREAMKSARFRISSMGAIPSAVPPCVPENLPPFFLQSCYFCKIKCAHLPPIRPIHGCRRIRVGPCSSHSHRIFELGGFQEAKEMKPTLGKKLGLGFGVILALMASSAVTSFVKLADVKQNQDTAFERRFPSVAT